MADPNSIQKIIDINTKQFNSIHKALKVFDIAIKELMEGDKVLISADLKRKDQITALQEQVADLELLMKNHLKSH